MDFVKVVDISYIIYTFALSLLIARKISHVLKLKRLILVVLCMSCFIPVINMCVGVKIVHHLIEFIIIWIAIYYFVVCEFNRSLFITTIFSLSFTVCRYILLFTYSIKTFYFGYDKVLNYYMIFKFEILVLFLVILFILFINYIMNRVLENVILTKKLIVKILIFLVLILLTGKIFDLNSIDSELVYKAAVCSIFISVDIGIICICIYKKYQDTQLKSHVSILENQMYYQEQYYENILKNYDYARRAKHDLNNHINVIRYLTETEDYLALKDYLDKINKFIPDSKDIKICGNKVINAICLEKLRICKENGIDIDFELELPDEITIEPITLCIVFGNLIDNAIEACNKIDNPKLKKFIRIESFINFNKIYIKIENSKINKIKRLREKFITSKSDKRNHGLGLDNVKYVVNKNKGYIEFKDLKEIFQVNLYMSLTKS